MLKKFKRYNQPKLETKILIAFLFGIIFSYQSVVARQLSRVQLAQNSFHTCEQVDAQELYAAYVFKYGISGNTLKTDFFSKDNAKSYNSKGYRPKRLTGYQTGQKIRYMTKWAKNGNGKWFSWYGITGNTFHNKYLELRKKYRPIDVSGFNKPNGAVRYAVIWERNLDGVDWKLHRDVSRSGMQNLVDKYADDGYFPVRVEGYLKNGQLRFISIWEKGGCGWKMHNKMTRSQYQQKFDQYKEGYKLIHLDAYRKGDDVFYAGIWWNTTGPSQRVRSNRDWYLFQRFFNNYRTDGYVMTNFLAVDHPNGTRYGGIWNFNETPNIHEGSSLKTRIRYHVDRVPGRAGAAMINLNTGDAIFHHADARYGTASTIKIAILYALLRKADDEGFSLDYKFINVGEQYGSNGGNLLTENQIYTLAYLAKIMINNSHNWATNRLIDYVGRDQINSELNQLGLKKTRLNRYMTGTGAPSAHGNSGPIGDYKAGFDNFATPREFAKLLKLIFNNNNLLTENSYDRFFDILSDVTKGYAPAFLDDGVATNWSNFITLYNKAGSMYFTGINSNEITHRPQINYDIRQSSDAGIMEINNTEFIIYAVFVDEWSADAVDPKGSDAIRCVAYEIAKDYSGQSTGSIPSECDYP